jgi:hypothetical protein
MGWRRAVWVVAAVAVAVVSAAVAAGGAPAAAGGPREATASAPSFAAPVELAAAQYGLGVVAATDAAGTTTAIILGDGAPKLLERPAGSPWPAPARLPGDPRGVKGPVVAAAGQGALGIAWRVDMPRKYSGIQAEVRDPGGALSMPIVVAGEDAGGVRHPALAVDEDGDALLAFNTDTSKVHLSLQGAVAVSYRPAHGSFAKPKVLDDAHSSAPAVALASDGTGIVAWSHNRRVYAVSIADGQLGKVKEVAASSGLRSVHVAAGPGGAATIAWVGRRDRTRRYEIRALRRPAGQAFAATEVVASTTSFVPDLALAADEAGRTTAAWVEDDFAHAAHRRFVTDVRAATAAPGHTFGTPRLVAGRSISDRGSPSIAAANGRVALAWGEKRDTQHVLVRATSGPAGALPPPQAIGATTMKGKPYMPVPDPLITLAPSGAATAFLPLPTEPKLNVIEQRIVAVDGR